MAKLEAMLEQRGIATPREMSEAIARCQLHGGDLTTSLLQFVSADEAQLSAALSECYGLPAASVGLLPAPDDAALRSFPRDVAEGYCCFPLEASPGRLVLAVAHPLETALREELGATLGVSIEERVALEVRIRQALSRFYGLPLSARNQRGIARLEGDVEGAGHETPLGIWSDAQLSALPRPPSELSSARESQRPPSVRPRPRSDAPRHGTSASSPPSSGTRTSRRRGPLTLAQARDELSRAPTRNDVLDIFFGFASQFFEYSALFAVHNALAEGLDAWGKGADRDTVLGIGVPLDLPSSLSEVAESCKVRLTRLGKEGIDRTLAADLQRQFNAKVLVLPVSLRGRCAVLLYADSGEADVVEREIADVIAIAPDVANALGRIILQRKKEARQRGPENSDLSALARRSQPPQADEVGSVPALLDALEPIPNENRDRSRNNARKSSRPDASPAPIQPAPTQPERDTSVVAGQRVVAIGPDRDGASPSPPAGEVAPRHDPSPGEDPVFLLARPQGKGRLTPVPPQPRPLPTVERPAISITHPAPIIGNRPRLPSVIVDPESADPEASERLTRAAAVTRAPTQARNGLSRRPLVPLLADAPRTLSPPVYDPTQRPARSRDAAARGRGSERESQPREVPLEEPQPSDDPGDAGLLEAEPQPREALHPSAVEFSEPAPPDPELMDEPSEERADDEEMLGATSNAWPPPIMDNSPPPRQPPLTALVPIIIADPPKGRRGYTARTATTARPGNRPGLAKAPLPRTGGSNPPAHGPASPTVPSPARARKVEPGAGAPVANANREPAPAVASPVAIVGAHPLPLAAPAVEATPDAASSEARPVLGEATIASTISGATGPANAAANGGSRLTNALARAAARAANAAAPRANDLLQSSVDPRLASATTAPPPGPRAAQASSPLGAESPSQRDSRPPPAPAAGPPRGGSPPPFQAYVAAAGPSAPRLVLPSLSDDRASRPPPAPASASPAPGARPDARASDRSASGVTMAGEAERAAPGSTVIGLGAASRGSAASRDPAPKDIGAAGSAPASSISASPAPIRAIDPRSASRAEVAGASGFSTEVAPRASAKAATIEASPGSTLIGVAALDAPMEDASAPAAAGAEPAALTRPAPSAGGATPAGTTTASAPPRGLPASLPPLSADEAPPDSVELAWDALISSAPPAAAYPPGARPTRPAPSAPAVVSSATPAAGTPASLLSLATPPGAEAGRASRPPSPPSAPFERSASAPPASVAASSSPSPSSPVHPVPSPSGAAPSSPIHPVPSRPMTASSSNSSATPSDPTPASSSSGATPSRPIHPLPSRSIDGTPQPAPSSTGHAPPSRPGSGSRPAVSASQQLADAPPPSRSTASAGAGPSSSPASGGLKSEARAAIFPPPPPVNTEIEELVDQVCQGNLRAVQDLARIGAPSVPQVMARFPGPVISERAGPSSRASECGPLLQALAAIGSPAMPSVTLSSEHEDARVRRWATLLLGEMPGPEACRAVVQRLADDVPRVHQAALDAARLLLASSAADLFRKTLFEVAEAEDAPLTLRLRTLEHVAKLKDSASVPRLISFLGADMEPIVHKALWALTVVTRHDFGRDARAWTDFWSANQARHRLEWLIDALDDRDPRLRRAAADELREEAGELFGYAEDLPRSDRLQAQREFRNWWETSGARRHARPGT